MHKHFNLWLFLLLTVLISFGCNRSGKEAGSGFYAGTRSADLYRIPILEPVELFSADEFYWMIDLPFKSLGKDQFDYRKEVEQFCLVDSVIITYVERTGFQHERTSLWIAIDIPEKKESFFTTQASFETFAQSEFGSVPKFYEVNETYLAFKNTGKLIFQDQN